VRLLLWFEIALLAVAVFMLAFLAEHAVSAVGIPPPDAQQKEYEDENRSLIRELVAAEKRRAPEEELEKIRAQRREVNRRHFEYVVRNR
jgi:hypothetical protein